MELAAMRMHGFFKEAVPLVIGGVLVVNIPYYLHIFTYLTALTAPVVIRLLGLPEEATGGLLIGFLRKDVAVGMLSTLDLDARQLTVACVVLAMSFPCIAAFVVLWRELGLGGLLRSLALMITAALITGGLLNLVL